MIQRANHLEPRFLWLKTNLIFFSFQLINNFLFVFNLFLNFFNSAIYLFKSVFETKYENVTGSQRIDLDNTAGMVSSWMFYFQRSDANLRNEWSNYTNWPYNYMPRDVVQAPTSGLYPITRTDANGEPVTTYIGPGVNPDGTLTGWVVNQTYTGENEENILMA